VKVEKRVILVVILNVVAIG